MVVETCSSGLSLRSSPLMSCVLPVPELPHSITGAPSRVSASIQKVMDAVSVVGTVTSLIFMSLELNSTARNAGDAFHGSNLFDCGSSQ